jgi:hypothetical protein
VKNFAGSIQKMSFAEAVVRKGTKVRDERKQNVNVERRMMRGDFVSHNGFLDNIRQGNKDDGGWTFQGLMDEISSYVSHAILRQMNHFRRLYDDAVNDAFMKSFLNRAFAEFEETYPLETPDDVWQEWWPRMMHMVGTASQGNFLRLNFGQKSVSRSVFYNTVQKQVIENNDKNGAIEMLMNGLFRRTALQIKDIRGKRRGAGLHIPVWAAPKVAAPRGAASSPKAKSKKPAAMEVEKADWLIPEGAAAAPKKKVPKKRVAPPPPPPKPTPHQLAGETGWLLAGGGGGASSSSSLSPRGSMFALPMASPRRVQKPPPPRMRKAPPVPPRPPQGPEARKRAQAKVAKIVREAAANPRMRKAPRPPPPPPPPRQLAVGPRPPKPQPNWTFTESEDEDDDAFELRIERLWAKEDREYEQSLKNARVFIR